VSRRWDQRFLDSTRGQIVALLRGTARTVNELAAALDLTDNAVRAHLATLERDGLIEARGTRRGVSKPSIAYDLTAEGERIFARAHEPVLGELLAVLAATVPPAQLESILRETGRRLAGGPSDGADPRTRAADAAAALEPLGGALEVEERPDGLRLRSRSCPLGTVVAEHAELCQVVAALIGEVVGAPARSCCEVGDRPRCCFELATSPTG